MHQGNTSSCFKLSVCFHSPGRVWKNSACVENLTLTKDIFFFFRNVFLLPFFPWGNCVVLSSCLLPSFTMITCNWVRLHPNWIMV